VAIPHYKQRPYLERVLHNIFEQTYDDFEIVVSDDCSPDDSNAVIPQLLASSGRPFRYYAQPTNLGYDGNVRFCLSAAQGQYVFMLGNDDALGGPDTLQTVAVLLNELELPDVAFVNCADWASGTVTRKAFGSRVLGSGPETAIRYFRSFSFISGCIFKQQAARQHETDRWDRSVFYQIYLASRIVAAGGRIAGLDVCAVRSNVRVDDAIVPTMYTVRWANAGWSWQPRHTGLDSVIRVTADAIVPFVPGERRSATLRQIIGQALTISYPYWLLEYRRVANWSFAVGIARDMWPRKLLAEYALGFVDRISLWGLYLAATTAGLIIPNRLFSMVRSRLAAFVRRIRQKSG